MYGAGDAAKICIWRHRANKIARVREEGFSWDGPSG
jgi:hypothetical protein